MPKSIDILQKGGPRPSMWMFWVRGHALNNKGVRGGRGEAREARSTDAQTQKQRKKRELGCALARESIGMERKKKGIIKYTHIEKFERFSVDLSTFPS
jgi:hypothetical protein